MKSLRALFTISLFFTILLCQSQTTTNPIYLPDRYLGTLFMAVQTAHVFPDSKTFVDCVPKIKPFKIVEAYEAQKQLKGFSLDVFVSKYFDLPKTVVNGEIDDNKDMIVHLKKHWPSLVRESKSNDKYTTLISLPHPFVVPGGRFREMFYWDSYFTIIGLLESGEDKLALGMIRNFAFLVNQYGHIPNGNRTYFLSRSQPPFFAEMLKAYSDKHGMDSIMEFLPALEKEYAYWTHDDKKVSQNYTASNKSVWLDGKVLNRYTGSLETPRAEAFDKEYKWAQALSIEERPDFYRNLRAACESGWDFSSRWFADGENKTTVQCESLIPVCLNSLLYNCEIQLATMYKHLSNTSKENHYKDLAKTRKEALITYCWDDKNNLFNDYNFATKSHNQVISLATVYPLFFGIANQKQADDVAKIINEKFLVEGGVVTTLVNSGEQWDSPNGWAPLQYLTVMGLSRYGHNDLAKKIAERWLAINNKEYQSESKMMEKYNVVNPETAGGGGNYSNQDGFGWTNGVDIALHHWLLELEKK